MKKMKIKKGDTVIVLCGKDKGKKGKVLSAFPAERRVMVERVGVAKKHQKPSRNFQGGIIEKPLAIDVSKVMLVCPRCSEPARLTGARACVKCRELVDKVK